MNQNLQNRTWESVLNTELSTTQPGVKITTKDYGHFWSNPGDTASSGLNPDLQPTICVLEKD